MRADTFSSRVLLLVSLMVFFSVLDLYRNGTKATRYREYGFILVTGALGGIVGFVNDWITSSISPDYFILGKGLEQTPDLRLRAAFFGLQVGISAGIIGGALCLYVTRRKSAYPPAKFSRLFQLLWMPVLGAVLCGVLLPLGFSKFDPARFSSQLDLLLKPDRINRFREVWWIHIGLYAGLIVGLTAMMLQASKERRAFGKLQTAISE